MGEAEKKLAEEAIVKLRGLSKEPEAAHCEAEDILVEFLTAIGHAKVAETFEAMRDEIGFWYA